jgi:hypothetical protein
MNYEEWRNELFGQPPEMNLVTFEHCPEFYDVPPNLAFDYIDHVLVDPEVHTLFSKDQLGNGIDTIYSANFSDLAFLYKSEGDETRRIRGIENLDSLYKNYFERYCTGVVNSIGNDDTDGPMGTICYMFWDVFILFPGNATPAMIDATLRVMRTALESHNDNCLASAIHGLGHKVRYAPEASRILQQWLLRPTTKNPEILRYAQIATTGMIQ